ncbi:MAG: DUF4097 family beta strand repeat protein [Clostridia bacterium]|nr:DUF4097 family beta strand repeat protein [Clostridia bacterium]
MKKALPCLLLLISLSLLLFGCGTDGTITYAYPVAGEYTAGDGEAEDVTELLIDWVYGAVTVKVSDVPSVRYSESGKDLPDDLQMRTMVRDGVLVIAFAKPGVHVTSKKYDKSLTVLVPKSFSASEIDLRVVSADLRMEGLNAENASIKTVSGEVTATDLNCDALDIDTVSGDVDLNGTVSLLTLGSVSGDVRLTGPLPDKVTAETVSGNFTVKTTAETGFSVTFETVSGRFHNGYGDGTTFGDGNKTVAFKSVSGDLNIEK